MAPQYGEVRVDYITYTTGVSPNEGNATIYVSGLVNKPTFSGDVVIKGELTVEGDIIASGDVTFEQSLTVSGDTNLNTLTVTGNSQIDDLFVGNDATVTGNTNLKDNLVVGGTTTVTGISTFIADGYFSSGLYVSNNATVTGNLSVEGTISGDTNGGVYGNSYWKIPSGTTAQRPGTALAGMMRWNQTLVTYEGYDGAQWGSIGGGATGSGTDRVFLLNEQTVNTTYTIPDEMNATSCGPITIVDSAEVIIGDGENWSIV
jgi:cytoskeletal protein CcmA (bactofilin family)